MAVPPPTSKPVRIREIAIKAQCTTATVSLALNNSERLPERTRQRIQKIAREMGYIPNRQAKSLSLGRTGVVGVIMPMASDPYYAAILDALVQTGSERGLQLQVQFHRWAPVEEFRAIQQMAEARVDGILHYPARVCYDEGEIGAYLRKMATPLCLLSNLGNSMELPPGISAVIKDYSSEAAILSRELVREGHRKIDILQPAFADDASHASHYRALLAATEIEARLFTPEGDGLSGFSVSTGLSPVQNQELHAYFIESYVNSRDRANVVLTSNFRIAWGLFSAMTRRKLRCPEDISIISIGHSHGGNEGTLPLTALEYNPQEIASNAFDLLLAGMQPDFHPQVRKISPHFIYRDSCPQKHAE